MMNARKNILQDTKAKKRQISTQSHQMLPSNLFYLYIYNDQTKDPERHILLAWTNLMHLNETIKVPDVLHLMESTSSKNDQHLYKFGLVWCKESRPFTLVVQYQNIKIHFHKNKENPKLNYLKYMCVWTKSN